MAVPNMIVTLLANIKGFSTGMRTAGQLLGGFGKGFLGVAGIAAGAMYAIGNAIGEVIPYLVKLGVQGRVADERLRLISDNMLGVSRNTTATTERMKEYAKTLQETTAIDDEFIKSVQAKLLAFKGLAQSANITGGMFDRVTKASIDMAQGGFGAAETNAVKLARTMQDPIHNLTTLNRLGVVYTDQEKKKALALEATNGKMAASNYLLGIVEGKFKGVAERTADPLKRISLQFEDVAQAIGWKLLGAVDVLGKKIIDWVDSPEGEAAIKRMTDAVGTFVSYITSAAGQKAIGQWIDKFATMAEFIASIVDGLTMMIRNTQAIENAHNINQDIRNSRNPGSNGYVNPSTGGARMTPAPAGMTVNFNSPIDSVSAGREISRVLSDFNRASGRR